MTQAYNLSQLANNLDSSGKLDATDGLVNAVPVANGGTGAANATSARSNLGLGSLATQNTISNDNWSGTDLSVSNGGTGTSSISGVVYGNGTGAMTAATSAQLATALGGAYGVTSVNTATGAVTLSSLSDFNRSLSANGYQKLPGGMIMQWGKATIPDGITGVVTVTFPIAFNNIFNIQATLNLSIAPTYAVMVDNVTTASMRLNLYYTSGSPAPIWWFAIGN